MPNELIRYALHLRISLFPQETFSIARSIARCVTLSQYKAQ